MTTLESLKLKNTNNNQIVKKQNLLQIDNTIISLDVIEKNFACDLSKCKGNCCVYGDSGAPLTKEEADMLENIYPRIKPFLRIEGIEAIEKKGTSMVDSDGDTVTPLISDKECAYAIVENGIFFCGIEKAYAAKKVSFQKPLSCHLFPIRTKDYTDFSGVNFEKWETCKPAEERGNREEIPALVFLRTALIRKFGKSWYKKLKFTAEEYNKQKKY